MALLGALSGAVGLLNGFQQNARANAMMRRQEEERRRAMAAEEDYRNQMISNFHNNEASGAYNSDAREKQLRDLFGYNLTQNLGNANNALTAAGSRSGDSRLNVTDRNIGEHNALGLSNAILDTRDKARNDRLQGLMSTNPHQYTSALTQDASTNYQQGMNGQQDLSQLIGNIAGVNWGGLFGHRREDPYAESRMDMNPMHQYGQNGKRTDGFY